MNSGTFNKKNKSCSSDGISHGSGSVTASAGLDALCRFASRSAQNTTVHMCTIHLSLSGSYAIQ